MESKKETNELQTTNYKKTKWKTSLFVWPQETLLFISSKIHCFNLHPVLFLKNYATYDMRHETYFLWCDIDTPSPSFRYAYFPFNTDFSSSARHLYDIGRHGATCGCQFPFFSHSMRDISHTTEKCKIFSTQTGVNWWRLHCQYIMI